MAATRALIRRGVKRLHLVALPTSSLQADLLIGAGCVETIETSAVSLGEFGPAPRFTAAVMAGTIRIKDATCPALHAAFQAAEKGVPFMPLRGLIGSDVLAHRPDWKVDRQSVRQRRSDRAAAGDQARRRAVPRAARRPRRQRLDRPRPRARHHGACGGEDRGDGGEASRGKSVRRSPARGRRARRLLRRDDRGRAERRLAARACRPLSAPTRRTSPNMRAWPRAPKASPPISTARACAARRLIALSTRHARAERSRSAHERAYTRRIHHFAKRWIAGSSPAMTTQRSGLLRTSPYRQKSCSPTSSPA